MKPEAIVFDLFETLVSESGSRHPSTREVADALGVDLDAYRREYHGLWEDRYTGKFKDYPAVVRHILARIGASADDAIIADLYERRVAELGKILCRVEPEILDMLAGLRDMGLPLGLISNTEGSEIAAWGSSPLAEFFAAPVFSHELGRAKPARETYAAACAHLGVAPQACFYVGDGGRDELTGAARMGMQPYCAAWFMKRHADGPGSDAITKRAVGFPVWHDVSDVLETVAHL